jgi:two-component system heavy metal sensor histidine kinase CusS
VIGARFFQRWSITSRLSFFFALSSIVLLAVVGVYLYRVSDTELDRELTELLADTVDFVRIIATRQKDAAGLARPHFWDALAVDGSRLHMVILGERNEALVATSKLKLPSEALPAPAREGQRVERSIVWVSPDGGRYRVVAARANVGTDNTLPVLIVVALDITAEHRRLQAYNQTLIATLLLGAIVAAALGYVIVHRGLTPLRRIATAANAITSTGLQQKLELVAAPDELRALAAAFNGMLDRLHDSFSRLSQFSSDIAHELRTPINNLMGEAQVALSRARTAEEYREVLASSVEEYERLARMIENMLFLARADDPQTKIAAAWIDARAELERIAEFYQLVADESGVRIRCAGNARIYADPILFGRAIGNLLSNALRYCARGSEVVLQVGDEPDGGATASVRNSGAGIAAEHLLRIFDRLYRIAPSREKTTEGAGLGLAIVKSIMELHRGSVSAASDAGGLTVFRLRFPPAADKSA